MEQSTNQPDFTLPPLPAGSLADAIDSVLTDVEPLCVDPALGGFAPVRDIFAEQRRKGWDKSTEARCNFDRHPMMTRRAGVWFISLWKKSVMGRTLSEIKSDPAEVEHFASEISALVADIIGPCLSSGGWCVCTSPKRRHKVRNFASMISAEMGRRLGIPFYEDVATCRNRQRVNAVFDLNILPDEPNVIVFDDFVTTGSTLRAMKDLLLPKGKNLLFISGINNKL